MKILTIDESLKKTNTRFFKDSLKKEIVEDFKNKLKIFDLNVNQALSNNENEEYYKGIINNFLRDNFYSDSKYDINTKGNIDSAIRENNNLICIIEAKTPNNTGEMIKQNNLNKKAMHELVLYYLEETRDCSGSKIRIKQNAQIKNLVATNAFDWYIFSSKVIEKFIDGEIENYFYQFKNGKFVSNKNEIMYQKIEFELNNYNLDNMEFTYFNINNYYKKSNRDIGYLYKIFSRFYLLNDKYYSSKNVHVLNNRFYQELLYILGLTEYKDNNKNLIKLDDSIINSIGYQTYRKYIDYEDKTPKEAYELTLDSIIIWMDRLLFIKLFESQLINFNSNEKRYHILDNDKIKSFDNLENLFFSVLGKRPEDRQNNDFFNNFEDIPYLNSALFERQDIERDGIAIHELDNLTLKIKGDSILKSNQYDKLPLLEYIINFLNSYDFGLVSDEDDNTSKGRDIIDAAVLGLIFEKINGYKDGSIYTPSTITEFIAKQAVEYNILTKLNKEHSWNCKNFDELTFQIKSNASIDLYKKINEEINSITYCDPAVGSGHFLVSVLNRIIASKYELGVLLNHSTGYPITSNTIYIEDDVLIIQDAQRNNFKYNKHDIISQQLQETLFYEKKTIIEKCIFGVDLNDKAVQICRLRLWIELLKNAFYKDGIMQTLPNIDINIKTGNSCISRLPFDINSKDTLGKKLNINGHTKIIADMKKQYEMYVSTDDKALKKDIVSKLNELDRLYIHPVLQGSLDEKENARNEQINKLYKGSLEWSIQFSEILDNEGRFLGFDCIIGNPPYIQLQSLHEDTKRYEQLGYDSYDRNGDIYCLFIELATKLGKKNGYISYITSNKWLKAGYGSKIRKYLLENVNPIYLMDLGPNVFQKQKVQIDTCIISIINNKNYSGTTALKDYSYEEGKELSYDDAINNTFTKEDIWNIKDEDVAKLLDKIRNKGTILDKWNVQINKGIMSGYNDAYYIDTDTYKKFINSSPSLIDYIKPLFRGRNIEKYYTNQQYNTYMIVINSSFNLDAFPILKEHLENHRENLEKRAQFKRGDHNWYAIDNCPSDDLIMKFNNKKIIYSNIATIPSFSLDDSCSVSNDKTFIMTNDDARETIYLCGILNSKLMSFQIKNICVNLGKKGYELRKIYMKLLSVPKPKNIDTNLLNEIIENTSIIIDSKKNNNDQIADYVNRIDTAVYKIYNLSDEEIELIEKYDGEIEIQ